MVPAFKESNRMEDVVNEPTGLLVLAPLENATKHQKVRQQHFSFDYFF